MPSGGSYDVAVSKGPNLGHVGLAESILNEILTTPKTTAAKPYVSALCKVILPKMRIN